MNTPELRSIFAALNGAGFDPAIDFERVLDSIIITPRVGKARVRATFKVPTDTEDKQAFFARMVWLWAGMFGSTRSFSAGSLILNNFFGPPLGDDLMNVAPKLGQRIAEWSAARPA